MIFPLQRLRCSTRVISKGNLYNYLAYSTRMFFLSHIKSFVAHVGVLGPGCTVSCQLVLIS